MVSNSAVAAHRGEVHDEAFVERTRNELDGRVEDETESDGDDKGVRGEVGGRKGEG